RGSKRRPGSRREGDRQSHWVQHPGIKLRWRDSSSEPGRWDDGAPIEVFQPQAGDAGGPIDENVSFIQSHVRTSSPKGTTREVLGQLETGSRGVAQRRSVRVEGDN